MYPTTLVATQVIFGKVPVFTPQRTVISFQPSHLYFFFFLYFNLKDTKEVKESKDDLAALKLEQTRNKSPKKRDSTTNYKLLTLLKTLTFASFPHLSHFGWQ